MESNKQERTPVAQATRKKKFKDVFIAEDITDVGSYVFLDVIVPAIKRTIVDIISNGINSLFYGRNAAPLSSGNTQRVAYNKVSQQQTHQTSRLRRNYGFDDLYYPTKEQAQDVINNLKEEIEMYGNVSVSAYYEYSGVSASYTDLDYGWYDLRQVNVPIYMSAGQYTGKYYIDLPPVSPLPSARARRIG